MFFVLTDYLVFILINELKDSNRIIGFKVLNIKVQPTKKIVGTYSIQ